MWRESLIGLLIALCFFGLLEAGARLVETPAAPGPPGQGQILFVNDNDRDRDFAVERDPDLGYRLRQTGAADAFTDSSRKTYQRRKPEKTFRIICLGGSTTYGTGSEFSGWSYPALLEALFQEALAGCDRTVEVINAGMLGYHSWHSRIRVETELDALSPDLYLVMDGVNDIASIQGVKSIKDLDKERSLLTGLVAPLEHAPGPVERLAGALSHLAVYRLARDWTRGLKGDRDYGALLEAFGYRNNLVTLIKGREAKGIDTVVVNYPWSVRAGGGASGPPPAPPHWDLTPETIRLFRFGREAIAGANRQVVAATRARLIDPQPLLDAMVDRDGYYSLYSDPVHFTKRGNMLLAREIYQRLLDQPGLAAFLAPCRLPDQYALDSKPLFHALATWGEGYRGQECRHGQAVGAVAGVMDNVAQGEDAAGDLRPLRPQSTEKGPGVIRVALREPVDGEAYLYPRLCGVEDRVTVWGVGRDGGRRRLFFLQKAYDDGLWMPYCTRYALPGPLGPDLDRLEVELGGGAQIFARDGEILFR